MLPSVTYTPCATSSRGGNGGILAFAQFEEDNLLCETRNYAEIGGEYDDDSIMPPLLIEEEMNVMDSGDESDHEPMYTEMLEYICDISQSHPNINNREARYNIGDRIRQRQSTWKGALKSTKKHG